jgi:enterochelin esterase family protein
VQAYSDQWHRTLKDSMRSTEYDTVSDRYHRFFRDELLAEVAAHYDIRKDAYSRGITGLSSDPEKILREPAHNLRVWLQDGANDQENDRHGSWPLANLRYRAGGES